MRVAISGTHRVGKTSLAEALASALPGYRLVPEPYHALEEDGHDFGETPSMDDFVLQLEHSLDSLEQSGADTIFDRCPLDIVAYLQTHEESGAFEPSTWDDRIREAMSMLSLLVIVPIEHPDRIPVPPDEWRLRADVDERIADLAMDGRYAGDVDVVHVAGPVGARVGQVLRELEGQ